jgi:hypothetical protein
MLTESTETLKSFVGANQGEEKDVASNWLAQPGHRAVHEHEQDVRAEV